MVVFLHPGNFLGEGRFLWKIVRTNFSGQTDDAHTSR
jgi:hypothetical protein